MSDLETRPIWIVWQNTDLTEGRGYKVPIAFCANRWTAHRAALGKGVQGGCADVEEFQAVRHKGYWCAPFRLIEASKEDLAKEKAADELDGVISRAKALGMTEAELQIISRGKPK